MFTGIFSGEAVAAAEAVQAAAVAEQLAVHQTGTATLGAVTPPNTVSTSIQATEHLRLLSQQLGLMSDDRYEADGEHSVAVLTHTANALAIDAASQLSI